MKLFVFSDDEPNVTYPFQMKNILKEACVETIEEALFAQANGADRVEYCARLDLDGLTPDKNLVRELIRSLSIPAKIMVRPRAGNFIYSKAEVEEMKSDILFFKTLKVQGVVFGILDETNHLNIPQIKLLAEQAAPLNVTVHKAIDSCSDPLSEMERLMKIKEIGSVLTSGKSATAIEGEDMIRAMIKKAGSRIEIIAAGKITSSNFEYVHQLIGGSSYHGKRIVELLQK